MVVTKPKDTKTLKVLEDSQLTLRPFKEEHITEKYIGFLNNPQVNQFLEVRHVRQSIETVQSYVRTFYGKEEKYMWGIYPKGTDDFIGTITLGFINRRHGWGEIGLMVGDSNYWGKGVSEAAMSMVARHAFEDLKLRRLTGGNMATNTGINFTFKRLGFRLEAKLVQAYDIGQGKFVDGYRWGLLIDEWRKRDGGNT